MAANYYYKKTNRAYDSTETVIMATDTHYLLAEISRDHKTGKVIKATIERAKEENTPVSNAFKYLAKGFEKIGTTDFERLYDVALDYVPYAGNEMKSKPALEFQGVGIA